MSNATQLLIVDDEDLLRRVLVRMAEAEGYAVHGVASAAAALHWLTTATADVVVADASLGAVPVAVVADVMLPGMDGCTLGREIVRRWPGVRLLFISGYVTDELRALGTCPETMPLLVKPFTAQRFLDRLEEVLASPPWDPEA